jgi:WD40-like Beta Propeller Repeat
MKRRVALAIVAGALLTAAPAHADVFAAVDVAPGGGRHDLDVAVMNASTGARVALPAGTNTTADELHPTISTDGQRLTFMRRDDAAGTVRIVVVDLGTSQSADLFSGFETAQQAPGDPAITRDGNNVFTGGPFEESGGTHFASIRRTTLFSFPGGPFPHATLRPQYGFASDGALDDLAAGGHLAVYRERHLGAEGELVLVSICCDASPPLAKSTETYANPNLAATDPDIVVFDRRFVASDGVIHRDGDIVFRPAAISEFVGTPTTLPPIVNTSSDESQPALSADGRYLAFVRHGIDGHDRLFLWDSQTQTLLNSDGVELGATTTRHLGAVSLYSKLVMTVSTINLTGVLTAKLIQPTGIGIIVQRIRGRKRVLGHRAFKLGAPKRVPFGRFPKGHLRVRWNFKVHGHRLKRGRYLVTPRAVTRHLVVRELGRPRVIRIR